MILAIAFYPVPHPAREIFKDTNPIVMRTANTIR
jgi:hypothetical protein